MGLLGPSVPDSGPAGGVMLTTLLWSTTGQESTFLSLRCLPLRSHSFSSEVCLVPSSTLSPKQLSGCKSQVLGRGQSWNRAPLTSPVHPPSDSAVYFPSGKPGVSLSPAPACPPDARSKMTGTDWFTRELPVRPSLLPATRDPHPGGACCPQQASKSQHPTWRREESRDRLGPACPHPEPGLILQSHVDTSLVGRRRSVGSGVDRRRRKQRAGPQGTPGGVSPIMCRCADCILPSLGPSAGPARGKLSVLSGWQVQKLSRGTLSRPQVSGLQSPEMLRSKRTR